MTSNAVRRMLRYMVPVDDQAHRFPLTCDPVAVAAVSADCVEFWVEDDMGRASSDRLFQVFGTGQPLPENARHVGTCLRTREGLVWHLYELVVKQGARHDWRRRHGAPPHRPGPPAGRGWRQVCRSPGPGPGIAAAAGRPA